MPSLDTTALAFDWGGGGPSGTAPDTFSIRWKGTFTFSAGTYLFTVGADDGVRLKIDGITQIDDWSDHAYRESSQSVALTGGPHLIEVEYFENLAGPGWRCGGHRLAAARPATPPSSGPISSVGCVYDNTALAGAPQTTAPAGPTLTSPVPSSTTALAFDWGGGGPSGTAPDTFSIRWKGTFTFSAGTYLFTVGADDGVRLKIDGITQIDDWSDHAYRESSQSVTLTGGPHLIEVEYFENFGGARVEVRWQGSGGNQPDLLVTALSGPTMGTIGGQITVSTTLRNQGTVSAGAFRVGYYWSQNATITTGDVFSGWFCDASSGLGVGATGTCNGPVGVPSSLTPGVWYLGAIVDNQGVVGESNEGNNARAADTGPITLST